MDSRRAAPSIARTQAVKRRTTEITIELESLLQMRWWVTRSVGHCIQCQKVVTLLSPHEDGKIDNSHLSAIFLLLEGVVHIIESENGTPRICLQSLLQYLGKTQI
jgi:hypothetical protein